MAATDRQKSPRDPVRRRVAPTRVPAGEVAATSESTVDTPAALGSRQIAPARLLSSGVAQRLQASAGNRAVSALLAQRRVPLATEDGAPVQRLATAPAEAPAGPRGGPDADAKFAALRAEVRGKQKLLGKHPPATSEAAAAARAAKPPADDREAQGKVANAEKMNAARPGEFDKAAFVRAVNAAIAAQAPKNLDEADKFGDSGKADAVKDRVRGQLSAGKDASANAIETATKAAPDPSAANDKPVTPLSPDKPPGVPGTPDPANAVPDRTPASATDFSAGPAEVDARLAGADPPVTEEQLAKSNEPEFTDALREKKASERHAAIAPGQLRAAEARIRTAAKARAGQAGAAAMAAMAGDRKSAGADVAAGKAAAKGADEAKRAQITTRLQKVFDATQKDVANILAGLDKKVDDVFTTGEKAARDAFTADHKRRMDAYKARRYSGLLGKARWVKDKFAGLPEEANQIFGQARQGYVARMGQVISSVADVIGAELTRAKQRIAAGRNELQAEIKRLPADLAAIGRQAAGEFGSKFDELTESVDAKGRELVNTLATRYHEAVKAVDEEIAAEKEKNKGLVARAVAAVGGVIKTITQLKDMLLGVLAKAASAVMAILRDPIGFLGRLVSAVGAGLRAFLANIGEHLKKGLVGWLTGAMAATGLRLPARFDLKGILMMVASLLGLTWNFIRGRIISRGVPAQAMGAVEQSVPMVQKLRSQGVGGIWEEIKEKIGDLKDNLFTKISEYLIPTILVAGITWIVSLLNPASAFVRACKMIIDFVRFIVNQGAQIIAFVNSVLDAIVAIANGGTGGVPALIEKALAKSIPVLIGALAAILGIGGIAEKVKKFFQALAKPVMRAVDWVVDKIVKLGKSLWAKLKAKIRGGDDSAEGKQKRLDLGVRAGVRAVNRYAGRAVGKAVLTPLLAGIRVRHGLTSLDAVPAGEHWAVAGKVNPEKTEKTAAKTEGGVTGAVAAYRGIHFKLTWDQETYDKVLRQNLVGRPEFSHAARELAGSKAPDGSDVPEADLVAAAQLVQEQVKQTKNPASVRQWWSNKSQVFDSQFLALLQRYVNTYEAFEQEMKEPSGKARAGLTFTSIPFISTSKNPKHSARYALGDKFIADKERRTSGTVGRVFVYVFSLKDIAAQNPANVQELHAGHKVNIKARIINEGEVTFTGYIPGENRVAQVNAEAGDSAESVAESAAAAAESHAAGHGGLRDWDS